MKPIYFSKVEFVEILGYGMRKSVMLLDLEKRELLYQVFVPTKREIFKYACAVRRVKGIENQNSNRCIENDIHENKICF